ncbi:MAG: serine/threonine protein kinase [Phycisphaeraceae bacterium]|nr:MAG: serine/threonine protein kinase [Phycisphaeraceae bacterium]
MKVSEPHDHFGFPAAVDLAGLRRFERVRDVLAEVADLPHSARAARLEELAGADPPLQAAVAALLANLDAADRAGFLADSDLDERDGRLEDTSLPERLGRYRLVRRIGEGGTGIVYLAESPAPLARQVAVKLARSTGTELSATRAVIEAEALASLNHPGIAQVFETGVLEDGRQWMACEWIDGEPVAVAAERLDWRGRVGLIAQAADAVHHAHQCGVIHRDIKPSNLLVAQGSDGPRVKVIDFGVARLLTARGAAGDVTEPGLLVGTLSYMSREQLSAGAVDARTDVHGLGLVACEVLSGSPPPGRSGGIAELTRAVQSPTRVRLSGCSGRERDLEAIIAKATDPDPVRRYPSMQHFGDDLRRVLSHIPIEARRPSLVHSARLYAERRPWLSRGILATSLLIGALVVLLAASRVKLAAEIRDQQQLVAGLVEDALAGLREIRGTRESRMAMVDALMVRVERHAAADPDNEHLLALLARVLRERGDIAAGIGRDDDAIGDLTRSMEIYRVLHRRQPTGIEHGRRYAEGLVRIGDVLLERDRQPAADKVLALYLQAMNLQKHLLGANPGNIGLLDDLSWSYDRIGEVAQIHGISTPNGDLRSWLMARNDLCYRLLSLDPDRALSRLTVGTGYLRLAKYYGSSGRAAECYQAVTKGIPHILAAVRSDPGRWFFIQILLGMYSWEVNSLLKLERHDEVAAAAHRFVSAARSQVYSQPGELIAEMSLASALFTAARALKTVGNLSESRLYGEEALVRLEALEHMVSPARWRELCVQRDEVLAFLAALE